jgi:predicted CoA-substrate-specific enzyme activase
VESDVKRTDSLYLGIDIGSISLSAATVGADGTIEQRFHTVHAGDLAGALEALDAALDLSAVKAVALTGRLPAGIAGDAYYDSQVAALASVRSRLPQAGAVLVVGGEGFSLARIAADGNYEGSRSNSGCAAGTGSFLDQQAGRLGLRDSAELAVLALSNRGEPPKVATRCAVFAKTDLIHAQQEGYPLAAIADGLCRGLARNLADSLFKADVIREPVVFTGGVACNTAVLNALRELSGLDIVPDPEALWHGAIGAALLLAAGDGLIPGSGMTPGAGAGGALMPGGVLSTSAQARTLDRKPFKSAIALRHAIPQDRHDFNPPLSITLSRYPDFSAHEHYLQATSQRGNLPGQVVEVDIYQRPTDTLQAFLGVDIGSTSTKAVLMDRAGAVVAGFYTRTAGRPAQAFQALLEAMEIWSDRCAVHLVVLGCATTGSGRKFIGGIAGADLVIDEISAHARAAVQLDPRVDTIIEIGGQDSKFTTLHDGRVTSSIMNNVCAAGTGSFIEEQARRLGVDIADYAGLAEGVRAPKVSDRCTVFMERDINHLLAAGCTVPELLAAALHAVRENYLRKVATTKHIGSVVFFQGATARNRALVAAFEQRLGIPILVSPYCHLTGAFGAALTLLDESPGWSASRQSVGLGASGQSAGQVAPGEAVDLVAPGQPTGMATVTSNPVTHFRGLALYHQDLAVRNEVCELCTNHCKLSVVNVAGEDIAFGFLCGRDYSTRNYVAREAGAPRLARLRAKAERLALQDINAARQPGERSWLFPSIDPAALRELQGLAVRAAAPLFKLPGRAAQAIPSMLRLPGQYARTAWRWLEGNRPDAAPVDRLVLDKSGAAQKPGTFGKSAKPPLIGLPAALHLADEIGFWQIFFQALGIPTVSSAGRPGMVTLGKQRMGAEFCAPMAAFHGHVLALLAETDYVFAPLYLQKEDTDGAGGRQFCYCTQYAPALVSQLDGGGRILAPLIESGLSATKAKEALQHCLAKQLGLPIKYDDVAGAWDRAMAYRQARTARLRMAMKAETPHAAQPMANLAMQPGAKPAVQPRANLTVQPEANPAVQPRANLTVQPEANPAMRLDVNPAMRPNAHPAVYPAALPDDIGIIMLGRPYVVLSADLNKGIPDMITDRAVPLWYEDMIEPVAREDSRIQALIKEFPWEFAKHILRAAEAAARLPGLYPVLMTSFKCGPDSFAIDAFKAVMDAYGKPFLVLELDEHDSSVGYETRIEAAIRAFRNHHARYGSTQVPGQPAAQPAWLSSGQAATQVPGQPARQVPGQSAGQVPGQAVWQVPGPEAFLSVNPHYATSLKGKTLLLPCWDDLVAPLLAASLRAAGIDAIIMEETDETIRASLSTNSGQCLPLNAIAASFAHTVRKRGLDPAACAVWMARANFSCNIPLYPQQIKTILDGMGGGLELAAVYVGELSFLEISPLAAIDAYLSYLFAGLLRRLACRIRPYEHEKGWTDATLARAMGLLVPVFEDRRRNKVDAAEEIFALFDAIPYDRTIRRPLVAIFGDFYVRDNQVMSQDVIHYIEEQGGEVISMPYNQYAKMVANTYFARWMKEGKLGAVLSFNALLAASKAMEKVYYKVFGRILEEADPSFEDSAADILTRYEVSIENSGESAENLLKTWYIRKHFPDVALFVQLSPVFCCAGLVTEAMNRRIEEVTGVPVLSLTYDGAGSPKNNAIAPYLRFTRTIRPSAALAGLAMATQETGTMAVTDQHQDRDAAGIQR